MGRVEDLKRDSREAFLREIATVLDSEFYEKLDPTRTRILQKVELLVSSMFIVYKKELIRKMAESLYREFQFEVPGEDIAHDPVAFRAREILSRLLETTKPSANA